MYEHKKVTQPVQFEAIDIPAGKVRILNENFFVDLSYLNISWQFLCDLLRRYLRFEPC